MAKLKRTGIDVRSGSWMFNNNGLLVSQTMPVEKLGNIQLIPTTPDQLHNLLDSNADLIYEATEAYYTQLLARNPDGEIYHPWLHTLKIAHYADTFTTGLVTEAEKLRRGLNTNSNDGYLREEIRKEHYPYLDLLDSGDLPFMWRVPGRMIGYDIAHDGLWLEIKHRSHHKSDTRKAELYT